MAHAYGAGPPSRAPPPLPPKEVVETPTSGLPSLAGSTSEASPMAMRSAPEPSKAAGGLKAIDWKPAHKQSGRREAKKAHRKLVLEEAREQDFHGAGGTVEGFRAVLAHKYGGSVRGWRDAIALENMGLKPVTFVEFCQGMRRVGFGGKIKTLWQTLSKKNDYHHVGLEDVEPALAKQLDALVKKWCRQFPGGCYEAWPEMQRDHVGRCTLQEFSVFLQMQDLVPEKVQLNVRQLFDALDVLGCHSVTCDDLQFIDKWAEYRFGVPAPPQPLLEKEETEPWSPPPPRPASPRDLAHLRRFLEKRYGSAARAWRTVLDVKGVGYLGPSDFGMGCRQAGWAHSHNPVFRELKAAGGGLATMRALDPRSAMAVDKLNDAIRARWEDVYAWWSEVVDRGGLGSISQTEFCGEVAEAVGLTSEEAAMIFKCLDTQNTGWVAVTEIGFLDLFQSERPLPGSCFDVTVKAVKSSKGGKEKLQSTTSSLKAGSETSEAAPGSLPRVTSSASAMNLLQNQQPQTPDLQSSGGQPLLSHSMSMGSISPSKQEEVWRPTRSVQRIQYSQSHMVKHRWLTHAAADRCLYSSRHVPKTKRLPWTTERDIFRSSNEFYRAGVERMLRTRRQTDDLSFGYGGEDMMHEE
eukprot:TRINITY_DN7964_c0_g2_i1.p1 TRINITY_DN7964_c0_g2~~TRINITY_DN7964_c0_g2_i1.p1  ORF type:complete len:634 (-),score=172.22 TRINITY_DN7964_c0_g2_i1:91-1992(-)